MLKESIQEKINEIEGSLKDANESLTSLKKVLLDGERLAIYEDINIESKPIEPIVYTNEWLDNICTILYQYSRKVKLFGKDVVLYCSCRGFSWCENNWSFGIHKDLKETDIWVPFGEWKGHNLLTRDDPKTLFSIAEEKLLEHAMHLSKHMKHGTCY